MPLPKIEVPELNLYESKLAADEQKYKNAILKAQYDKLQKGNDPDEIERTAKVVNMARGASTKEEADAIINKFAPDLQGIINVYPGKEVTIRTDDGTEITIPPEMQDMFDDQALDPKKWADPNFSQQALSWGVKNGISIKRPDQKQYAPSETERLVEQVNSLPEGDPRKTFYTARLKKLTESKQQRITVGPDGSVSIVDGPAGADPGITKKTQGETESKIIDGSEQLARLTAISNEFKPEFQEIGNRLSKSFTGIKAKLGRGVSKEDAQGLTEFKKYQRKAIENINLYIKDVTGAAMSEAEAARLRLAQPDPGENWWSGDDPITFKAKLDDITKATRAAVARYNYYKSKGLSAQSIRELINSGQAISLDSLQNKMK